MFALLCCTLSAPRTISVVLMSPLVSRSAPLMSICRRFIIWPNCPASTNARLMAPANRVTIWNPACKDASPPGPNFEPMDSTTPRSMLQVRVRHRAQPERARRLCHRVEPAVRSDGSA